MSEPLAEPSNTGLLAFAKRLQQARTFDDLLETARSEVEAATGYRHVWFMVADDEDAAELRLIQVSGEHQALVWEVAPVLQVAGDAFLEALIASDVPIVIEDARLDPRTNKQIVEQLQNRTLINVPLRLLDKPFGIFGLGTFGDEGCRAPTPRQVDYLVGMAGQIAVAAGRIRFLESRTLAEREKAELERRLLQMHKLESLGMLAGGIAHDFNNLLTVILSSAVMAEGLTDDADVVAELRAIVSAAGRGSDLTRKLLAMSRAQDLDLRTLDLNARLDALLELLRRVLPSNIQLDLIRASRLPLVEADPSQLDQVFLNLCINARDAMPDGGRLTIETEQVLVNGQYVENHPWAKPGRYTLVTVTDTGIGMSREVAERIFEPFFTTKGEQAGIGLGLAVCYGIVRQHGGMLHCYSEEGLGTSFKLYLPAVERLASAVGNKIEGSVPRGDERILVVEDDSEVRSVAVKILEQAGYGVTAVADGDEACRMLEARPFDLVVLDVVMPGMPCREVVHRCRVLRPGARVLLASGYTAGTNVVALVRETGLELLRKPYDPDQLLRSIRGALDRRPPIATA